MRRKNRKRESEYDDQAIRAYMALPAKEKFQYMESFNRFLLRWMPASSKRVWRQLKKRGW